MGTLIVRPKPFLLTENTWDKIVSYPELNRIPSRMNIVSNSSIGAQGYFRTIVDPGYLAPDGTQTAFKLVDNDTIQDGIYCGSRMLTFEMGRVYTASIYCKQVDKPQAMILLGRRAQHRIQTFFDFTSQSISVMQSVTPGWTNLSGTSESVGDGWYRISVTGTYDGGGTEVAFYNIGDDNQFTQTGVPGEGTLYWGLQVNEGELQDYMPTTGVSNPVYYSTSITLPPGASGIEVIPDVGTNVVGGFREMTNINQGVPLTAGNVIHIKPSLRSRPLNSYGVGGFDYKVYTELNGYDIEAWNYIYNVEQADGQPLELGVKQAINQFVQGCKSDGIWDDIHTLGLLFGARTLAGALIPLKGPSPTNFNFVSSDYDRKTGLVGNGINKRLDTNTLGSNLPMDNFHAVAYKTVSASGSFLGGLKTHIASTFFRNRGIPSPTGLNIPNGFFYGTSRGLPDRYSYRYDNFEDVFLSSIDSSDTESFWTHSRNVLGSEAYSNARIQVYSLGTNINLANYRSNLTLLVNTINSSIP